MPMMTKKRQRPTKCREAGGDFECSWKGCRLGVVKNTPWGDISTLDCGNMTWRYGKTLNVIEHVTNSRTRSVYNRPPNCGVKTYKTPIIMGSTNMTTVSMMWNNVD